MNTVRISSGIRLTFSAFLLFNGLFALLIYFIPYNSVGLLQVGPDSVNYTPIYALLLGISFYLGYKYITRDVIVNISYIALGLVILVAALLASQAVTTGVAKLGLIFAVCNLFSLFVVETTIRVISIDRVFD